ncbi:MAG: hypothetical protein J1E41_00955 [Ruminococcus sp.]|nr:hypothetical protein [Ruminococcus sp.]
MTSLESMIKKLLPLNIYRIEDDTNIKNELSAYAYALDIHRENIDTLIKECFISSAEDYGIEIREKVIGDLKSFYDIEKRREMLTLRKGFNDNDFTADSLGEFIKSFGVTDYRLSEVPTQNIISVCVGGSYSDSEARWIENQIRLILPAHLTAFVYFGGKIWRQLNQEDKTFKEIDAQDLMWQEFHLQ